MYVILLERVEKLGAMGDVVRVKDGFARNYLLPTGKALRSNESNKKVFEAQREVLETRNAERRSLAETRAATINGKTFIVIRQAGESGQLYGSVSTRDIADIINAETGADVARNQVVLEHPIKTIGMTEVKVSLHAEVPTMIYLNIARSEDEAQAQSRGEDMSIPTDEREAALEAAQFDSDGTEDELDNPVSNFDDE